MALLVGTRDEAPVVLCLPMCARWMLCVQWRLGVMLTTGNMQYLDDPTAHLAPFFQVRRDVLLPRTQPPV